MPLLVTYHTKVLQNQLKVQKKKKKMENVIMKYLKQLTTDIPNSACRKQAKILHSFVKILFLLRSKIIIK